MIAAVGVDVRADYFKKWIADGMHGDMAWLARNPDRRTDARQVLPEARSLVVVGLNYYQPHPPAGYRIAKYALGADYHDVILARLQELCCFFPPCASTVDIFTSPLGRVRHAARVQLPPPPSVPSCRRRPTVTPH